jgi:hypothetical protein
MLTMMKGKTDRRVWFSESYAVCKNGKTLFEFEANSPIGQIKETWDGRMKPGAWLLSLWYLPNRRKDFLDLTPKEIDEEENTWTALQKKIESCFSKT